MGFIGLLAAVITTAGTISASKRAAKAQREATAISTASQDVRDTVSRRRLAREERIRRSRLIAGSVASGAIGSSGLIGAEGALTTNTGSAVAQQRGESLAARGISAANQRAADAQSKANQWRAFGSLVNSGLNLYKTYSGT